MNTPRRSDAGGGIWHPLLCEHREVHRRALGRRLQGKLHQETYELIIHTVRDIIDSVQPKTAFYTLEPMPWMLPDGRMSICR